PRTFVVDVGAQEQLNQVKQCAGDFDMNEVASIMDSVPITSSVIKHWKEKAADRKTVVFCATVNHAQHVCDAFNQSGVNAVIIHGQMSKKERKQQLHEFEQGAAQVIVNVFVLTEGYDYTPISCVVLLRPSSFKSTLIQMVGRGLRTVDPLEFPEVIKKDCIVLDFGTSTLIHGTLEQDADLDVSPPGENPPTKECPDCEGTVPIATMECPLCGYIWEPQDRMGSSKVPITDFIMSEIDLFKRSNFLWIDLFGHDDALMATGFSAWAGIFLLNGQWYSVGGDKNKPIHLLAAGERTICLAAADDWLNDNETADSAHKSQSWLNQSATEKQLQYLPAEMQMDYGLTRYKASVLLSFKFNKHAIRKLVYETSERQQAA
ncbi:MAG: helicase, partial [Methylococcales bacterium]|nr:helicase [Methylococcales bacterium]